MIAILPNDADQSEEDNIFADEITDEALEAAASGPIVTFTLSVVLFACQFCPSAPSENDSCSSPSWHRVPRRSRYIDCFPRALVITVANNVRQQDATLLSFP